MARRRLDRLVRRVELPEDRHARARTLAVALAERFSGCVDPEHVETNIVCASAARLPLEILPALASAGIRAGTIAAETVRFVTHKDVDDADIARAIGVLADLVRAQ